MKYALVIFLSVVGCAGPQPENTGGNGGSSGSGGAGGSGGSSGSSGSGGSSIDAPVVDASPDGAVLGRFGDPCSDRSQCMSNICVFAGLGGTCTQVCPNIGCPNGYGCYGVLGAIDPGVVSNICVPENNLLCTPCSRNTECGSPTGGDMCLPYPTGTFCGRDCSSISCPPTYTCMDIPGADGGTLKQCVPNNNACDCTPANAGNMVNCTITTPLGTACGGHRTCNGAQGWSACAPPSTTDLPDDNFADDNCDGIDGDASNAIFVDVFSGNDNFPGTRTQPVVSITRAMTLAGATKQILVSKGDYPPLTLVGGAHIYGGYDASNNWQRSASNIVRIIGASPAVDANNITQETRLDLITVVGSDATGIGQSSYGVHVTNSSGPIILHALTVRAGNGTDGSDGFSGGTGANGQQGGPGDSGCQCGGSSNGGTPGASSCNGGGSGGTGTSGSGNALPGSNGSGLAPGNGGSGGLGCAKDCFSTCGCGGRTGPNPGGTGGTGANGMNGAAAAALGVVSGGFYVPANGSDGSNGADGSSGGGGGGGAGSDGPCLCNTYRGGGGGGGGGAGCHGTRGTRGSGGGGSFAVFVVGSTVTVERSTLVTGNGGRGGNGGSGGLGGAGGPAGNGGSGSADGEQGAQGGAGGPGGTGGSGSGASGGPAYGIYSKSSTVTNSTNTFQPGSGGAAGLGGANIALGGAPNGAVGGSGSLYQEP